MEGAPPDPSITPERLQALPQSPGVYLMKSSDGEVLYVGKAKNLKNRVSSYFGRGDGRHNITYLRERIASVETLVTQDERQALILESDLIKKHKPRYNIRLKDDKAHLIVRIDMNHEWPRLELVRFPREDGARYIGPFAFSYELRTLLDVIKRTLPLRTCSDSVIYNRMRPCLEHQIKRCAAPCCLEVDHLAYRGWVEQAIHILQGNTEEVIKELTHDMERASEELRFEDAAIWRDRIEVLQKISAQKHSVQYGTGSIDAFGVYREGGALELSILMVRRGRLFESKTFGFEEVETPTDELLSSVLTQFYGGERLVPDSVLLPCELEDLDVHQALLSEKRGASVALVIPQRGSKRRLLALAHENAKENFEARFSEVDRTDRILKALQVELGLEQTPRSIECVDISHFQGGSTVAAVVRFQDMKPDKQRYRSFHLSQEGKPDDFASMREVLTRHLSRGAEENTLADLLVIDGGPAQLAQGVAVKKELGLDSPALIGLAKKRAPVRAARAAASIDRARPPKPERIYSAGRSVPIILARNSEALHLLERVRDEAHRFAIRFHRKTRAKKTFRSELDRVPGIGLKRRNELLREFRSLSAIREAEPDEIHRRTGIGLKLTQRISTALREKASKQQ